MKPFCESRGCTVVSQNPRSRIARSSSAMRERRYATFIPGKASVGPLGIGGTNALYSKRNVAQSSTVSQTPFSTAPNRYAAAGLLSSIDSRDAHPAQPIADCRDAHTAHFMTGRISSKVGALAI